MKFRFFDKQIQLFFTTLFLSTCYSLELFAQTKPTDSKSDIKTEITAPTALPLSKQEAVKYITYSVSTSGYGYGISGQFTVGDSKGNKLDKSNVIDFQMNAAYGGDQFLCDLDSLTSFEIANRSLSFKCENKDGLVALDSLSNRGEIRIVYNGSNRFGQNTSSFSGSPISIQKIYESMNNPASIQSFRKWCEQKNDLILETKKTVDLLLSIAGTTNCKKAMYKLQRLSSLSIISKEVSDLQPLSSLTNLNELFLGGNQISDLQPLSSLTNLTRLFLGGNQISDLQPLSSLTNLTGLFLSQNQISDLNPLTGLTNLKALSLASNQVIDVKPLSNLTNLTELVLSGNQVKDVQVFCKMPKLIELVLFQNPTSQLKCQSQG